MKGTQRPLAVTIIACVYILVGAVGFIYHFTEFKSLRPFQYDVGWVELVRLLAIVCGAFMLRGHNWARWIALAWIVFHVMVSALNGFSGFAVHCLFCAVIAWFLFRPEAGRYFREVRV